MIRNIHHLDFYLSDTSYVVLTLNFERIFLKVCQKDIHIRKVLTTT